MVCKALDIEGDFVRSRRRVSFMESLMSDVLYKHKVLMPCIRIQFLPQTRFLEPARKRERKELPLRASRQVHNCCPEL